jgi:excisionase family DNA binding protein
MPRNFLYLTEVATECRTSLSTIRGWIASGRLRATRPGRRLLVAREDLDALLNAAIRSPKPRRGEEPDSQATP